MSAEFSDDRRYRYRLSREWGGRNGSLVVIGLNPSTADELSDDPTIRRCMAFAKREGCSGLIMVNLFAFRATHPTDMMLADEPVAEPDDRHRNDAAIVDSLVFAERIIAAWGVHGVYRGRDETVRNLIAVRDYTLFHFGLTKGGHPRHPLYLRGDSPLIEWPIFEIPSAVAPPETISEITRAVAPQNQISETGTEA